MESNRYSRSNQKIGSYHMSDSTSPADRPEPPQAADEVATALGFLDYQRATFAWKCSGLDTAGLSARVGVSTMTLGALTAIVTGAKSRSGS